MEHHHNGDHPFFFWLLAGVFVLTTLVFLPYLDALVLSATFAIVFMPVHRRLARWFGGREGWGAFVTVLLVVLVIFTPLVLFGIRLFDEAAGLYTHLSTATEPGPAVDTIVTTLRTYGARFNLSPTASQVNEFVRRAVEWMLNNLGSVFSGVVSAVGFFFLSLLGLYYFLRDGRRFGAALTRLMPLPPKYTDAIFKKLHSTINSVVRGSLAVAIVQGILTGVGFWIFGVPSPIFWGSIGVITSLIPLVGTAIIIAPAIIYLALTGNAIMAVGLALWGILVVGLIDNLLRPYLLEQGVNIHPFLILLSVLGGLGFFGPIGFLLGPLVLSLLFALLEIYASAVLKKRDGARMV